MNRNRNQQLNRRRNQPVRSNDRQYEQSILRVPKQKLTLYGKAVISTQNDQANRTDAFTLAALVVTVPGFQQILTMHNAVKPLGFTLSFGPVDITSKLPGQISKITATRFNGETSALALTSTTKVIGDNGGRIVYIWPKQNRDWVNDTNNIKGGVLVSVAGFKQGVSLFDVIVALTVVFD